MAGSLPPATVDAVLLAAGAGTRAGGAKQYAQIGGKTMLERSLEALARAQRVRRIAVVVNAQDRPAYDTTIAILNPDIAALLVEPAIGGAERQQSVLGGLSALAGDEAPDFVLIHDAARPFVGPGAIAAVVAKLAAGASAVVPALAVADTLARIDNGHLSATVDRDGLVGVQTPQGFRFALILEAHQSAARKNVTGFTDDASVAAWAGHRVGVVQGETGNWKVTTQHDLDRAARHFANAPATCTPMTPRTGLGFDVHRFTGGTAVRLCGIDLPFNKSLAGHSDADVALHALTDAIYGAVGEGDIGQHFPDSEQKWENQDSSHFLAHAVGLVAARGARLVHVDITIICQAPKIGPHRAAMVARLAQILKIAPDRVSVKATTTETLGFTGRGEGIAAQAVATVLVPE